MKSYFCTEEDKKGIFIIPIEWDKFWNQITITVVYNTIFSLFLKSIILKLLVVYPMTSIFLKKCDKIYNDFLKNKKQVKEHRHICSCIQNNTCFLKKKIVKIFKPWE